MKYRLHENINILSFVAHRFINYCTYKTVTDSYEAERKKKRQRKGSQRLDDPPEYSSEESRWKKKKQFVQKNPEFKPQYSLNNEPSNSLLIDKCHFKLTELKKIHFVLPICIAKSVNWKFFPPTEHLNFLQERSFALEVFSSNKPSFTIDQMEPQSFDTTRVSISTRE